MELGNKYTLGEKPYMMLHSPPKLTSYKFPSSHLSIIVRKLLYGMDVDI